MRMVLVLPGMRLLQMMCVCVCASILHEAALRPSFSVIALCFIDFPAAL